ncbi:MAG TPA: FAD:protein FMN transferase [Chitinophagaceae bacterium]|jgi:thiamine biosynthesis lipoprotein
MLAEVTDKRVTAVFKRQLPLMGNSFEISVVSDDETWANDRIDEAVGEIRRIEKLLTTFSNDSETYLINENAGLHAVPVSSETFQLIERSIRISRMTQGAFDITYGSIDKRLWNFDKTMTSLPSLEKAKEAVRLINYRNIMLDPSAGTVFLKEKGMRIGFGGIGKGYAAEMAKNVMRAAGVDSGVVNASGDLAAWGFQPNGEPWTIGIAHPDSANFPFSYMNITDRAVATSGSYEKYVIIGGKKYSHTIDPRTGLPVRGIKSVTIISPNAELSDALATPVIIMGVNAGIHLINQLNEVECVVIDDDNRLYTSKNIRLF